MAHIEKRGNSYRIRVCVGYDVNGKKLFHSVTYHPEYNTPTGKIKADSVIQREVKEYAADFERAVKAGDILTAGNMKFSDLVERYLSEYAFVKLSTATAEGYRDALEKKIVPHFGHYKVQDLCRHRLEIQKFYNDMAKPRKDGTALAASTVRRNIGIFSSVMSWAVKMGIAPNNPLEYVETPRTAFKTAVPKSFTVEEARRFLEALELPQVDIYKAHTRSTAAGTVYNVQEYRETRYVPEQFKLFCVMAMFSGCRRGELIALDWSVLNFDTCTISISKSASKTKNGIIIKGTKTASGVRVINMPASVMDQAKRWQLHQKELTLQLGSAWNGKDNVFSQADGSRMYPDTVTAKFKDIIRNYNAQCSPPDRLPEISLHGLRHTSASILINQHADIATVSKRLGHSRTSVTLDIYTHAIKEADKAAAQMFENLLNMNATS